MKDQKTAADIEAYSSVRKHYEKLARYVYDLVEDQIDRTIVHKIEYRAKEIDSFRKKCSKIGQDGAPRYPEPLKDLTDLAGVRVIVFVRDNVDVVCAKIQELLDIFENEDVGDRVYRAGKFGYQSRHLLARLGNDRKDLAENRKFADLVCEIQVRTILQHAWAEMEHDIQYKTESALPVDLSKRFSALAGLLEIADREFASIQKDSDALKQAVKDELINELTSERLEKAIDEVSDNRVLTIEARQLIAQGRYEEAITAYTLKIEREPTAHTLYLGRAKARFLAGDLSRSLEDLDTVDRITGLESTTARFRDAIARGDKSTLVASSAAASKLIDGRRDFDTLMRDGNGVAAFALMSELEMQGFNRALAVFGKAVACALEKDNEGAMAFLDQLQRRLGTPMAVNIEALRVLIGETLVNEDLNTVDLKGALDDCPQYRFDLSPLKALRDGWLKRGVKLSALEQKVFAMIENPIEQILN